jgi:hypothetical protein
MRKILSANSIYYINLNCFILHDPHPVCHASNVYDGFSRKRVAPCAVDGLVLGGKHSFSNGLHQTPWMASFWEKKFADFFFLNSVIGFRIIRSGWFRSGRKKNWRIFFFQKNIEKISSRIRAVNSICARVPLINSGCCRVIDVLQQ